MLGDRDDASDGVREGVPLADSDGERLAVTVGDGEPRGAVPDAPSEGVAHALPVALPLGDAEGLLLSEGGEDSDAVAREEALGQRDADALSVADAEGVAHADA